MKQRLRVSESFGMSLSQFDLSFVAVGPQRTGTTWLYEMLRGHPQICMPEAVKETMFFDKRFGRGIDWYASYFDHGEEGQINGEVAPTYFDTSGVPQRINEIAPDCEIIISLRHPAERAFSLYLHHLKKGRVPPSLWGAIEQKPRILTAGNYSEHIPRWKSIFGKEQIHLLFLSDIHDRPREVLHRVCDWIGVRWKNDWFSGVNQNVNTKSIPRSPFLAGLVSLLVDKLHKYSLHRVVEIGKKVGAKEIIYSKEKSKLPKMSDKEREKLIDFYEEDIKYVKREAKRNLKSWVK